jgi:hypothetical protein
MSLFVPTTNQVDAEGTAQIFIKNLFCFSAYQMILYLIEALHLLYIQIYASYTSGTTGKQKLSTAFHPQTEVGRLDIFQDVAKPDRQIPNLFMISEPIKTSMSA